MWTANLPPWCPNRLYSRLALLVAQRNSVEGPDDLLNWLAPSRLTGPSYNSFFLRHYGGTEIFKVKRTCVSDWAIEWIVVSSKGHIIGFDWSAFVQTAYWKRGDPEFPTWKKIKYILTKAACFEMYEHGDGYYFPTINWQDCLLDFLRHEPS